MISIVASALDILSLVIKSIFKHFKHKKKKNDQKTIKELSSEPAGARSETPLRPEEGQRSSQGPRKRRKSVTETVTRTVVIETEGSPSSDPDEKTII